MSLGWMGQLCTRAAIGQAAQAANQPDEFAPLTASPEAHEHWLKLPQSQGFGVGSDVG
jgi:hypothetical protein